MENIRFYKFRYWILESVLSHRVGEEIKNEVFIKKFFVPQDIKLEVNVYKIKILSQKDKIILGQIGREKTVKKREDAGDMFVKVPAEDYPFIHFLANTATGVQELFIQTDPRREIYTSIKTLLKLLNMISTHVVPPEFSVTFHYTPLSPKFMETAKSFDFIEKIKFDLLPPNWLAAEDKITEFLESAKNQVNSDKTSLTYENKKDGLSIEGKEEKLKPQSDYSEKYGGSWKITGLRKGARTVKSKEDMLESIIVKIGEGETDDGNKMLDKISEHLDLS